MFSIWEYFVWKAIWVFIQHFPISGIISRYRELKFPISWNQFPISGNDQFPDIGKWFSDIGNWFSDIGKCAWFPDIGKSKIATRQKQVTPPPCNTALPHRPISTTVPSACGNRHYFRKSISATNNHHTTDDFAQKYRNLWCWIKVLYDINKNWTLR